MYKYYTLYTYLKINRYNIYVMLCVTNHIIVSIDIYILHVKSYTTGFKHSSFHSGVDDDVDVDLTINLHIHIYTS